MGWRIGFFHFDLAQRSLCMRSLLSCLLLAFVLTIPAMAVAVAAVEPVPANRALTPDYQADINDPIEPFNRAVFQFNRAVDFLVIKPVTVVYTTIVPRIFRNGITNFLTHLTTPVWMVNNVLQGDWAGFENNLHRLVINTTLGMGGVNDVARHLNVQAAPADFGQTLGKWGMGHGFYLVLPIIGPASFRDGTGRLVDNFAFDPYNIAFMESGTDWPLYTRAGMVIVDVRARYGKEYDDVMRNAVDPYITFRSIYSQRRSYLVQGNNAQSYDAYGAAEIDG